MFYKKRAIFPFEQYQIHEDNSHHRILQKKSPVIHLNINKSTL